MLDWQDIIFIVFAYLLGSIPFAYLFTKKFTGKNILEKGSGNSGSTNVGRVAGKKLAILTQICDILKGLLPVGLLLLLSLNEVLTFGKLSVYFVAFAAILGHNFSIFLKFKGGKGVNTTVGASFLIAPWPVLISVAVYFIVRYSLKFVSLGSLILAFTLVISGYAFYGFSFTLNYLLVCFLLIVIQHIPNIKRLMSGNEKRAD